MGKFKPAPKSIHEPVGVVIRRTIRTQDRERHERYGRLRVPSVASAGPRGSRVETPWSTEADAIDRGEPIETAGQRIWNWPGMDTPVDRESRYAIAADGSISAVRRT
jgi:hypothetical protein